MRNVCCRLWQRNSDKTWYNTWTIHVQRTYCLLFLSCIRHKRSCLNLTVYIIQYAPGLSLREEYVSLILRQNCQRKTFFYLSLHNKSPTWYYGKRRSLFMPWLWIQQKCEKAVFNKYDPNLSNNERWSYPL